MPLIQPKKTFMSDLPKYAVMGVFGLGLIVAIARAFGPDENTIPIQVKTVELSGLAAAGKQIFDENCAACHGNNASGTDQGPPLIHDIYNPGHHPDESFQRAVSQGVRQHHWQFGNMPRQPQMPVEQTAMVIEYIRTLQAANGIVYRQHNM